MWYLTSESDQRVLYIVPQKKEVIIGRSPDQHICDIAIQDDASISRKHAVLSIVEGGLFVKDLGSRYGTFINNSGNNIEVNVNIKVSHYDVIKFGKMRSIWRVHEVKLVTCTSTLKGENLHNLKLILSKIGGELKNDWDDTCEYLTMPAITLTIKVVLALVQGSYIVTTDFWNKCIETINNYQPLPDPKNFRPDILESTLNKDVVSFLPDKTRSTLFAGKKFIFFSKRQFEMYKSVLSKGAATPLLLSETKLSKSTLCDSDVVVIQYNFTTTSQESEAQKNQIIDIVDYLKSNGKRTVADPEIGLAILHCSTVKYCNPSFNFSSEVVKQLTPAGQSTKILAQETQELSGQSKNENVVINESLTSVTHDASLFKRKLDALDNGMETKASKKLAVENDINASNEGNKRKLLENDSVHPNKKMAVDNQDDFFNFITPNKDSKNKPTEKLNLMKPQKRRAADMDDDDNNLFNFIEEKELDDKDECDMFETNGKKKAKISKKNETKVEDIIAMRGTKLEELKKANLDWNTNTFNTKIKKEQDDLDEKMNQLEIGEVVVTINESLIVKKEPIEIETQLNKDSIKNYKKFKKIWPVKMQVTIIPKSSMIVVKGEESIMNTITNKGE